MATAISSSVSINKIIIVRIETAGIRGIKTSTAVEIN